MPAEKAGVSLLISVCAETNPRPLVFADKFSSGVDKYKYASSSLMEEATVLRSVINGLWFSAKGGDRIHGLRILADSPHSSNAPYKSLEPVLLWYKAPW